ncbi:MAG TPA: competence/damage-inducible protein A [Eubacteriaceae bacterium]|nr:competence/damage-inducible protein A [Eubacteriaceae bacterium]
MKGEIINVGTEILIGDILNTNSQYLSRELSRLGISVFYHSTIGDNPERLKTLLNEAKKRSDLIFITGGLGPTQDDLTKETVAEIAGKKMVLHQESYDKLVSFFHNHQVTMTENNVKQAYIPQDAQIIPNDNGTAPGILLESEETTFVLLPGPPRELQPMFQDSVIPYLEGKSENQFFSNYYKIAGIGESTLETQLLDLIENQSNPTIATYAKPNEVLVRVTANAPTKKEAEKILKHYDAVIRERFRDSIYAYEDISLNEKVVKLLLEKKATITLAESCTGGRIASALTEIPGVSGSFLLGLVTYSNQAKEQQLGVKKETLKTHGAVSRQCAEEMALGLVERCPSDIAVVTTGIAGPEGASAEKPVGLVYIGIYYKGRLDIHEHRLNGNRVRIQSKATSLALNEVRKHLEFA